MRGNYAEYVDRYMREGGGLYRAPPNDVAAHARAETILEDLHRSWGRGDVHARSEPNDAPDSVGKLPTFTSLAASDFGPFGSQERDLEESSRVL